MRPTRPKTAAERKARVTRILQLLDEHYPNVTCELDHQSAWQLLVATILSAQCTDKRVNMGTPELFRRYPTVTDLAHAHPAEVSDLIRTTGFFNNKTKSIIGAARKLLTDHNGEVPRTMEELLQVPGAARKTANVVLGNCFNINDGVVVDTHVQRLARRLALAPASATVAQIEQRLMELFPRDSWCLLSHLLIFHGRRACKARGVSCNDHPICREFGTACECRN